MNVRDRRGLKTAAKESLAAASYDPKKLMLIYVGAMSLLSVILTVLHHLLEDQIGSTGGLGGVGMRSVLETAQTVLMIGQAVALVFWQIGYVFVSLQISRGKRVDQRSLLEGFRRFRPVLRLRISLLFQYTGVCLISTYIASAIFAFTPWASPLMTAYETGSETELLQAMEEVMIPLFCIVGAVMLILAVPYIYRLRLAEFALMDDPKAGAILAVRRSRFLMRRNRMALLKLDFSFWWFYLCEVVLVAVAYGDYILPSLGVTLPWSDRASYYVCLLLSYVLQLALYWWRGNEVQVTYAKFYEALLPKEVSQPAE